LLVITDGADEQRAQTELGAIDGDAGRSAGNREPDVIDQGDGAALGNVVDGTPEDVENGQTDAGHVVRHAAAFPQDTGQISGLFGPAVTRSPDFSLGSTPSTNSLNGFCRAYHSCFHEAAAENITHKRDSSQVLGLLLEIENAPV